VRRPTSCGGRGQRRRHAIKVQVRRAAKAIASAVLVLTAPVKAVLAKARPEAAARCRRSKKNKKRTNRRIEQ